MISVKRKSFGLIRLSVVVLSLVFQRGIHSPHATAQETVIERTQLAGTPQTAATKSEPNQSGRITSAELKILERDVRALRDDVRRLSGLLEKRSSTEQQPARTPTKDRALTLRSQIEVSPTAIQMALQKPITIEFAAAPLHDVLREIKKQVDINIVIDEAGLEEEGLKSTNLVSIACSGISARAALKLILVRLNLTFMEEDEVLKITNVVRAQGELTTVIYPVDDVVQANQEPQKGHPDNGITELRNLITQTVSPESWENNGGKGNIQVVKKPQSLVIRQTANAHEQIDGLLQQLRRLLHLPNRASVSLRRPDGDESTLVSCSYAVADLIIPMPDSPESRTKVIAMDWLKLVDRIVTDIEPTNWAQNGGPCSIAAFEETHSLVIRATHAMHQSIADLFSRIRRDHDVQVGVTINYLTLNDDSELNQAGLKFDFDPQTRIARIDQHTAEKLVAVVKTGSGESLYAPTVTFFNGHIAYFGWNESSDTSINDVPQHELQVRGNVAEDRRTVRLSIAHNSKNLVNALISNCYQVNDGGYLLLDLGHGHHGPVASTKSADRDNAVPDKSEQPSTSAVEKPSGRSLVLIRPRIHVQEEEEELIKPATR